MWFEKQKNINEKLLFTVYEIPYLIKTGEKNIGENI
jgi:hypothetical protein